MAKKVIIEEVETIEPVVEAEEVVEAEVKVEEEVKPVTIKKYRIVHWHAGTRKVPLE